MNIFFLVMVVLLSGAVGLIVAIVAMHRLGEVRARLRDLEARLARIEFGAQGTTREEIAVPAPATPAWTERGGEPMLPPSPVTPPPPQPPPVVAPAFMPARDLETIVGSQWLTWLGIVAVFLGTAFFVAVDLGRSPLAGAFQVLAGFAVGVGFVVAGRLLAGRIHGVLGQGLLGGGVALLFLATYGAYGFHHLVPASVVHVFLLSVAVAGALLALRRDSYAVALLTAGGALLAPGLLPVPGDPAAALFPYLLALNLGGAIVSARRAWPLAPLLLFVGTVLILGRWWSEYFSPVTRAPALLVCVPLWFLYAWLPLFTRHRPGNWHVARSLVVAGAGLLFALALSGWLAPEWTDLRGTALALLALVQVGGARIAVRAGRPGPAARLLHYTGLTVAVIAVPVQLDLAWVTLAWALFGLILVWSGLRGDSPGHRLAGLLVNALAVERVLIPDSYASFHTGATYTLIWNPDFLAGLATVVVLGLTAWQMLRCRELLTNWERRLPTVLIVAAALLLFWRASIESIAWFDARAQALGRSMRRPSLLMLSLIWVVYAGLLILAGFLARFRPIRLLGVVVLGLLVLKMLALDLSVLEAGYRIASFLGVGVVLLAISVLYQRERRT